MKFNGHHAPRACRLKMRFFCENLLACVPFMEMRLESGMDFRFIAWELILCRLALHEYNMRVFHGCIFVDGSLMLEIEQLYQYVCIYETGLYCQS